MKKKINFHFSVDDVFETLIDISDKKVKLKNHWFFSQLFSCGKNLKLNLPYISFMKETFQIKKEI